MSRYGLEKRVRLVKSDLFASLAGQRYDLIVTNPPYVTSAAMRRLPAEYRHEPGLALAAGKEGLDAAARILAEVRGYLTRHGLLVCEVGDGRKALERSFPRLPFVWPKDEVFTLEAASMASRSRSSPRPSAASR
jgi:ribosomal protein L3 glutamine methyltransferase